MKNEIEEKELTEKIPAETCEELESLINSLDDLVYTLDAEQRFTAVFGKWKEKFGLSPDEISGKYFMDVMGCEDNIFREKFNEAMLNGKSEVYECSRNIAGNQEFYQTSLNPMRNRNGAITGIAGIIRNITKLKEAEIKIQEDYEIQNIINTIFQLSFQNIPLDSIFDRSIELIMSMPHLQGQQAGIGIFTFEGDPETLVLKASKGLSNKIKETFSTINIEGHYFKKAFTQRSLQFIDSSEGVDDRYLNLLQHRHYCIPLVCSGKTLGIIDIFLKYSYARNSRHEDYLTAFALSLANVIMQKDTENQLEENTKKLQKLTDRTIFLLSSLVEQKDPYIAGHQQRVAKLASNIGWELKLTDTQIHGLFISGLLHDIGKIGIPSEILLKPGRLHESELNVIKLHAQKGYDLLKNIDFPWPVAETAYQHHERLNGSGYPLGLTDKDILIESKILAVADVVEAMSFDRPYHKAFKIDEILKELEKNRNVLYDETVVEACVNLFSKKRFTWVTSE